MGSCKQAKFVIGIDLGTTNCALSYIDLTQNNTKEPHSLPIPQWESEFSTIEHPLLPSFFYIASKAEHKKGQLKLNIHPDTINPDFIVGRRARLNASLTPRRVIHSAKSWLCHRRVNREEPILPWSSDEVLGNEKRSPIEVSARYLEHLKLTWEKKFGSFSEQDITITVPASFDEVAQRLTLAAAEKAEFPMERVRLLEEPQAAFYFWLKKNKNLVHSKILVCDIGGGTTDFSLFNIRTSDKQLPEIERIAVSEHLLLGGDNIDLAIAQRLEEKLKASHKKLSPRQWAQLIYEARNLKEKALRSPDELHHENQDHELFISLPGEGGNLFSESFTTSITQSEIHKLILEGFFPACEKNAKPHRLRTGLTALGLPYAADSAISRHLSAFIGEEKIDAILFTGGSLKPHFIQNRICELITTWQGSAPKILENESLDLAVAHGAACYGMAINQASGLIKSGYPRSLYVEVAKEDGTFALVCLVPKGFSNRTPLRLEQVKFKLRLGEPVRFQLFSSLKRPNDQPGDLIALDRDHFYPLPPLHTKLDYDSTMKNSQNMVEISLSTILRETGILEVSAVSDSKSWQLEFPLRLNPEDQLSQESAKSEALSSISISKTKLFEVKDKLEIIFGKKKVSSDILINPRHLLKDIEVITGKPREEWDGAFLRSLWPFLEPGMTRRNRSLAHECSWLSLAGYSLRPGYGFALDEWRVQDLWRCFQLGLAFPKERQNEDQWWIMWRRVSGGLKCDQQDLIFAKIFPMILKNEVLSQEILTLAGSLERLEMNQKLRLAHQLIQQILSGKKQFLEARIWALGRIASRALLYAGPESIVPSKFVEEWLTSLIKIDQRQAPLRSLQNMILQAARMVGDRDLDLSEEMRTSVYQRLQIWGAQPQELEVLITPSCLDLKTRSQMFGESFPIGLIIT